MKNLTIEEYRMLADMERRMDSGEQPYVIAYDERMAVEPLLMEEFGLVTGQTISSTMAIAVMEARLASLQASITLHRVSH